MDARIDTDWPEAVEILNEDGRSQTVLLCEHASNHMPREYAWLGLDERHRGRHIAWDIGAAEVARRLSATLDAPAFLGNYSRLLIDLNRPPDTPDSIPLHSEGTPIPGNADIAPAERSRRLDRIFTPFHARVAAHLDRRAAAGRATRIVTIHSFTPVFFGERRPWHAGVLFGRASGLAQTILRSLRADPSLNVAPNEPYVISRDSDYAVPVHGDDRGIPAVLIEVRQDLISNEAGVAEWTGRLVSALPASPETIPT